MRHAVIVGFLSALLCLGVLPRAAGAQDPAGQILALVNQVRADADQPPLRWNAALAAAAQAHTDWRTQTGRISHTGAGGSTPRDRAIAAGYGGGASVDVAENIVEGGLMTVEAAIRWWRNSPVHYNTMTSPYYDEAGVGYTITEDGYKRYTLVVGHVGARPAAGSGSEGQAQGGGRAAGPPPTPAILPVAVAAANPDGSIIHTVERGQALWTIAAVYSVDLGALLAINGLEEGAYIQPGDMVIVRPADTPTPTPPPTATPLPPPSPTPTAAPTEVAVLPSPTPSPTPDPAEPVRFVANGALVVGLALLGFAGVVSVVGMALERLRRS
ncbi:MAG: CAP domain-containing protein [Anaerolineae bacterium]|nr:CAP domain-containing protein [Anaerolineae bacterium]